jgi:hypothetical protein
MRLAMFGDGLHGAEIVLHAYEGGHDQVPGLRVQGSESAWQVNALATTQLESDIRKSYRAYVQRHPLQ